MRSLTSSSGVFSNSSCMDKGNSSVDALNYKPSAHLHIHCVDRHTDRQIDTQTKHHKPHCAYVLRVKHYACPKCWALSTVHDVVNECYQSVGRRSMLGMTLVNLTLSASKQPKNSARMPNQAFKTNQKSPTGQYPAIHMPKSVVCGSSALRENPLTRDFTNSCHHHYSSSSSSVNPLSPCWN